MFFGLCGGSGHHPQNILLAQDEQLLAVDLDLHAAVLAEKHFVAHVQRPLNLPADGEDFAPRRALLGVVGEQDPAGRLGLGVETLDYQAVFEGADGVGHTADGVTVGAETQAGDKS